jgi:hypothetical protein
MVLALRSFGHLSSFTKDAQDKSDALRVTLKGNGGVSLGEGDGVEVAGDGDVPFEFVADRGLEGLGGGGFAVG